MKRIASTKNRRGIMAMDVIVSISLMMILLGLATQFHTLSLRIRREAMIRDIAMISASSLLERLSAASNAKFPELVEAIEVESREIEGLPSGTETHIELAEITSGETLLTRITVRLVWHPKAVAQQVTLVGWRPSSTGSLSHKESTND